MGNVWFTFILSSLAVYRLTRLAVDDDFPPIRAARNWVVGLHAGRLRVVEPGVAVRRSGARLTEALADLVTCRYCASGWVALAATVALQVASVVNLGWTSGVLWWFATWGLAVIVYNYAAAEEWQQPVELDDAVKFAVVEAAPVLVDRVADLVNERLHADPALSARGHVLAAIQRGGLAGALRYSLAEIPAEHRAELVADVLRELGGTSTPAKTGTLPT